MIPVKNDGRVALITGGMGGLGSGSLGSALKPDNPLLRADIAAFDVDALAFAAMSERKRKQISAKGGRASHGGGGNR